MYSIIVPKLDKTSSRIQIDFEFGLEMKLEENGQKMGNGNFQKKQTEEDAVASVLCR